MNITEQIDNFVRLNGGNERDALNVALARLDHAEAKLKVYELANIGRCDECNSELVDYGFPVGKECPLCNMRAARESAEARAAQAEHETKKLHERTRQAEAERDEARRKLEQAQARSRTICNDFMNQLPTLWGNHVKGGKIAITIDAELVERIEDAS